MESFSSFLMQGLPKNVEIHLSDFYKGKSIIVTGGASFIGSNLVDLLISLGAKVTVIDDLSSGRKEFVNLNAEFIYADLTHKEIALTHIHDADVLFHLAAVHGGRGFIETQQKAMLSNLAIDNNVYQSGLNAGVDMIVGASSACAYPINLQSDESSRNLLVEVSASMNFPETSFPDGVYGWVKLLGEFQLENLVKNTKSRGRSARIFTAYGERENESHAAIALMAKSLLKLDPFPVWGNGLQTRNFTYVSDTVTGLLLLGADSSETEFDSFNIGTSHHVTVMEFLDEIFKFVNWKPRNFEFDLTKPTGVASRASDNNKMMNNFGWSPNTSIEVGIARTLNWYKNESSRPLSASALDVRLMSR